MPSPTLFQTIVGALAANLVSVAVAFGAPLSQGQQDALLALVGSVSVAIVAAVSYLHGQHARKPDPPAPAK